MAPNRRPPVAAGAAKVSPAAAEEAGAEAAPPAVAKAGAEERAAPAPREKPRAGPEAALAIGAPKLNLGASAAAAEGLPASASLAAASRAC